MPTITLDKAVLEKLIGKKLTLEQLKDRISMLGTDLEKIEGNDVVVEVFPNRPDMLSEQGFARALASFVGAKPGLREYAVVPSGQSVIIEKSVGKVRPYTACAIVRGLSLDDIRIKEIVQLQEKLHITFGRHRKKVAIGVYPSEKLRYPIYYRAMKPESIRFRPLGMLKELSAKQIIAEHPKGQEYGHLLEHTLLYPVFADADGNVLSMPPIINSQDAGMVTEATEEVFIEVSGFDFEACRRCLSIIVSAMADMGGIICSMVLEYPDKKLASPDLSPHAMKLDLAYVKGRSGIDLSESEVKKLLERMGYGYRQGDVLVPAYRADILHPIDVVEDIMISYGYENVVPEIPAVATIAKEDTFEQFRRRVVAVMIGLGFQELFTYHLIDKAVQTAKMQALQQQAATVEIIDPVSMEYNSLRSWMLPSLIQVLGENRHREFPQRLFDTGVCFSKEAARGVDETGILEKMNLAFVTSHTGADYTEARQYVERLLDSFALSYTIKEAEHGSFIPGRVAQVFIKGISIAFIGELHPEVLGAFGLEMPVAACELDLQELFTCIFNRNDV